MRQLKDLGLIIAYELHGFRMKIKKGGNVSRMLEGIPIPDMFWAEQAFDKSHIEPAEIPSIVR